MRRQTRTNEMREIALESIKEDSCDYKPLDYVPDVMDKDFGFFLMFGTEDKPIWRESNNFDLENRIPGSYKK